MVYLPTFTPETYGYIQFNIIQYPYVLETTSTYQPSPDFVLRLEASLMWCSNSARCFWSWDSSSWRTRFGRLFLVGKVSKKPWNFAWNLWDQLDIEFLEHAFIKHLYQKKIAFIIWFQIRYQNLFVVYKFIGFHLCFFFKSLSVAIFFQPNLLSNKKPSTSAAFSLSANSAC